MIKIKQHGNKWRIEIEAEEWEFETRSDLEKNLKILLDIKEVNGRGIKYG